MMSAQGVVSGWGAGRRGAPNINLIPYPHHASFQGAPLRFPPSVFLHLSASPLPGIRRRAQLVAEELSQAGFRTQVSTSAYLQGGHAVLSASTDVGKTWSQAARPLQGIASQPEGYRLTIGGEGAFIQARDENGFYYAGQTMRQLLENDREVPGLVIEDGPLLPYRAIHLDLKGWMPPRAYLEETVERLAHFKFNLLILEYGRQFGYPSQPGLPSENALPPEYLTELDMFARDRNITLVPMLPCIADLGFLLQLEPYQELREDPRYFQQLCPSHPSALEIYTAMTEDLLAVHSGPFFHVGGLRARFLGRCPACQKRAEQIGGRSALYLEHVGQVCRYLLQRNRQILLWDEAVRSMSDEQIKWLPPQAVLAFCNYEGQGGRATQAILIALDRYKELGRPVWGVGTRGPVYKYEGLDNLDAWGEAAELGYLQGLLTTVCTREYPLGPLLAPPETSWVGALYAAERAWGGRKNCSRSEFLTRFGARCFGLQEQTQQQSLWGVFDMLLRGYPREAREYIPQVYSQCTRNQAMLSFIDSWCGLAAFGQYVERFEKTVAKEYANLKAEAADPFHAGRLRWRVEDLKAKAGDLAQLFRQNAARISTQADIEEFLNCSLAYGLRRLNELSDLLDAYPLPEKEWQQPVRV